MTPLIVAGIVAAGLSAFAGFCIALNAGTVERELESAGARPAERD